MPRHDTTPLFGPDDSTAPLATFDEHTHPIVIDTTRLAVRRKLARPRWEHAVAVRRVR